MKKYIITFCLFLHCAHISHDVDKERSMVFKALKSEGYTENQITGYVIFSCKSDFGMGFKSIKKGLHKSGVVCCYDDICFVSENTESIW